MPRIYFLAILGLIAIASLAGCATTTVTKNPDVHDKGIRYYRPKPYLLVKPLHYDPTKGGDVVSISVEYLPDYNEEYSIRVRAGLGSNTTNVTLDQGWNLTKIDQTVDNQFNENVSAIGDLLGGILPSLTSGKGGSGTEKSVQDFELQCVARNVPYGLYESVIGRDANGCKHLYGWRYVGFAPFAGCPMDAGGGGQCADCESMDLYGLIAQEGVMAFVSLSRLRELPMKFPTKVKPTPEESSANPTLTRELAQSVAAPIVSAHFGDAASVENVRIAGVDVEVEVAASVDTWGAQDIAWIQEEIQTELRRQSHESNAKVRLLRSMGEPLPPPDSATNGARRKVVRKSEVASAPLRDFSSGRKSERQTPARRVR